MLVKKPSIFYKKVILLFAVFRHANTYCVCKGYKK